ncbi:solute:sodium symporter family transporter [Rhodopirellula sp. MGV]|uniref:solute:sodium symporter family transporter n=1 Tax=Rhodopirellula sp. MGV TaxID=2023130 RepID=UPI000B965977|nr:solute:sodium symporter family transporter [Rhodopirellula sp. MGV]OYP37969.1 solute:sodium symporter family transporter [Rhodopirellula sp. MGV]PNY34271.1 solute:sodium symporter family transporter [Rhodopirellula baltica]
MTIATFFLFTALVAVATWFVTRGTDEATDEGYFLAGRSLTGVFIAGSLLLTNLSTEQLIGLNAAAFDEGLSVMAWEVVAGISLVALALVFLPRYLKSGIATIPQFFQNRYGNGVQILTTGIFVVAYMLILLPFVLYLGARGLSGMLQLETRLGLTEVQTLWTVIIFIAVVGGAYAIWGGLKAVAVSDTFNGAGLLIGGLLITYFTLDKVAGGDGFFSAFTKLSEHDPDAFQSLGQMSEDVSWPTLFTGVLLLNFFYWSTNQQIIQRTFGAKNLAEGQKGVLLAAFFKICAPLILVLPGIAAAYLVATDPTFADAVGLQDNKPQADKAYGALVASVLPEALAGFFAAVVVGSILSTFNSVLNSSATLFSLDIYKHHLRPNASTRSVVISGQLCSFIVGTIAVILAPTLFYGRDEIFGFFQKLNGVYFIPILAIMLVGLVNKTVDGLSALTTLIVGLVVMAFGTFTGMTLFGSGYHFMTAVFIGLVILQLTLGALGLRRSEPYVQADVGAVDLTPWKAAPYVGGGLIAFAIGVYAFFAL